MRILVAFTFSLGGQDAYALGESLSQIFRCPIDLVTIVRGSENRAITDATDAAYSNIVVQQANQWMDEAIERYVGDFTPSKNLRYAESFPEGIIESAKDLGSSLIVIGGGRHGALGKVALGSVGSTLLYSSHVPVALAPRGMRHHPYQRLSRITAMWGGKRTDLMPIAQNYASLSGASLRLVFLETDKSGPRPEMESFLRDVASQVDSAQIPEISTEIASEESIEDAISSLRWKRHEMVLLGSGRLAQNGRLFLGSTANKILRVLPVPLVVVPNAWRGLPDELGI